MQYNEFIWGDKWSIENDTAWFVAGNINALFSVDMNSNIYKVVTILPDFFKGGFRSNSNCIKCGDSVFCLPNYGKYIWCYELSNKSLRKIEINNSKNAEINIQNFWKSGKILWAVSIGLKQILEVDTEKKEVIGYYDIMDTHLEDSIRDSSKKENYIYIASSSTGRIFEFDTISKEIKIFEVPKIKKGICTISALNGKIWLSGYEKQLYIWEKENNKFNILNDFPSDFGMYNFNGKMNVLLDCQSKEYKTFTFLTSVIVGNYVWYIPFQTNKILYVCKKTDKLNVLEIEGEEENERSIKERELNCKFVFLYIYKNQYIGLFSLKNEMVYEIDTKKLIVRRRTLHLDINGIEKLFPAWILKESVEAEHFLYQMLIERKIEFNIKGNIVGEKIYNNINGNLEKE